MKEAVIVGAVRTPVGRYIGALRDVQAYDLAALVLDEALKRAGVSPESVDHVVLGQSYQNGESVNIARMALLRAGWPDSIPAVTLDSRCCLGLHAVCVASMMIRSAEADVVVTSREKALAMGLKPMATLKSFAAGAVSVLPPCFIESHQGGANEGKGDRGCGRGRRCSDGLWTGRRKGYILENQGRRPGGSPSQGTD